jgi:NAD(P)H-nitrite reductase large subunit
MTETDAEFIARMDGEDRPKIWTWKQREDFNRLLSLARRESDASAFLRGRLAGLEEAATRLEELAAWNTGVAKTIMNADAIEVRALKEKT